MLFTIFNFNMRNKVAKENLFLKNQNDGTIYWFGYISPTKISPTTHFTESHFTEKKFQRRKISPTENFTDEKFHRRKISPTIKYLQRFF
jgi:hypothetical protein